MSASYTQLSLYNQFETQSFNILCTKHELPSTALLSPTPA